MGVHISKVLDTVTSRDHWRTILRDQPRGPGYTIPVFEAMVSVLHGQAMTHVSNLLPTGLVYSPTRHEIYYPVGVELPSEHTFLAIALKATARVLLGGLDVHENAAFALMGDRAYVLNDHASNSGGRCPGVGLRVTLNHMWRYPERGEDTPRRYPCPWGCDSATIVIRPDQAIRADLAACLSVRRPDALVAIPGIRE